MTNKLSIRREYWPEVTDTPHFIVNLIYEGCNITHDDIYFNDINELIILMEALERDRKGVVNLQGGYRFNAIIESTLTGGMKFHFIAKSSSEFPGKLILEGCFSISGEAASEFLTGLIGLLKNGQEFVI